MRARPCVVCDDPVPMTRHDRMTCSPRCRKQVERAYRAAYDPKIPARQAVQANRICNRIITERLLREAIAIGVIAEE
jgi:hypothetical protein